METSQDKNASQKPEIEAAQDIPDGTGGRNRNVKTLPFSKWWPVGTGALLGIMLRLVFSGKPGGIFSAMNWEFILLVPFAVGAMTVYVAEKKSRRSWGYYIGASALANVLFVLGTMAILIEGVICVIIIAPLFAAMGAVGGLVMGGICRATNWPKHAVYSFSFLPLLLGTLPDTAQNNQYIGIAERAILIPAAPDQIWHQLHNVRDIKPEEVGHAWMYRIGVPLPVAGVTQQTPTGLVRKVTMGKSIQFNQVSTNWKINEHVLWRYHFHEDSFPPKALDDHVKIGGHYFDLIDTEYTLISKDPQSTELRIRMSYRVSTQFNWYAIPIANLLIGNFENVILDFYRQRAIDAVS